jgi:hypothetical protein
LLHPGSIPSSTCAIYSVTFETAFNTPPFFQGALLITLLNALSLSLSSTASYLRRIHNCGPSSPLNVSWILLNKWALLPPSWHVVHCQEYISRRIFYTQNQAIR